jgi:phosphatidylserine decarboxylase
MAQLETPPTLVPAPITSAQPGGGTCMQLELAWGHCRRALLRFFRPNYVRHTLTVRRGTCPDCPHDVIDARDLKFYRNVCGFYFLPEDDRFAWRGRLRLARYGLAELVCFSVIFSALFVVLAYLAAWYGAAFWFPAGAVALAWLFVLSFFRDPERIVPADPDLVVSPADGTVDHVGETAEPDFPTGRAVRISIFLSVFNVHVNRVPRTGRVTSLTYYPGGFLDARHPECGVRNEQFWIDLEDGRGQRIRVKQVAGAIARRIVCWLRPNEEVTAGARFGMIKFGSRTDVLVPADAVAMVVVKVGDKVRGGATGLLRLVQHDTATD